MQVSNFRTCSRQQDKQAESKTNSSANSIGIKHVTLENEIGHDFHGTIIADEVDMPHGAGSIQAELEPLGSLVSKRWIDEASFSLPGVIRWQ